MSAPDGLHARGAALWEALAVEPDTSRGAVALEACRIADRLEELDRIIAGKGVLNLLAFRVKDVFSDLESRHVSVEVKFQSVLSEARQQAVALTALLAKLGLGESAPKVEEASPLAAILSLVQSSPKSSGRTA